MGNNVTNLASVTESSGGISLTTNVTSASLTEALWCGLIFFDGGSLYCLSKNELIPIRSEWFQCARLHSSCRFHAMFSYLLCCTFWFQWVRCRAVWLRMIPFANSKRKMTRARIQNRKIISNKINKYYSQTRRLLMTIDKCKSYWHWRLVCRQLNCHVTIGIYNYRYVNKEKKDKINDLAVLDLFHLCISFVSSLPTLLKWFDFFGAWSTWRWVGSGHW